MAVLDSPTTTDQATVGVTSKALYTTPYGTPGDELAPAPVGVYSAAVMITLNSGLTTPAYVWGMSLPVAATRTAFIRAVYLRGCFPVSASAAASQGAYQLLKVRGVIDTATGTAVVAIKLDSAYAAAGMELTTDGTGGITFLAPGGVEVVSLGELRQPRRVGSSGELVLYGSSPRSRTNVLELLPGESLVIKALNAITATNENIGGAVNWEERT